MKTQAPASTLPLLVLVRVADADVAAAAQISERTARALIARGAIASIRIGRCQRVRRADLDRLLSEGVTS